MKKQLLLVALIVAMYANGFGQVNTVVKVDTTRVSIEHWQRWMNDMNEMGVDKKNDSFFVKEEVVKLLKDSAYRMSVYPVAYNWPAAVDFLNRMELKKAFWQLINLYQEDTAHRNIVIGTFVLYDSVVDMDKMLLNTFYTYAFTDPQVCRIKNNKPDIFRPDILEKKLKMTKEIISYIWLNRKMKAENNNKNR